MLFQAGEILHSQNADRVCHGLFVVYVRNDLMDSVRQNIISVFPIDQPDVQLPSSARFLTIALLMIPVPPMNRTFILVTS